MAQLSVSRSERQRQEAARQGVQQLRQDINNGTLKTLYVFHGQEQYLMSGYLDMVRKALVTEDFAQFNHKRLSGKNLSLDELQVAVDTVPAFAERTLVEVEDFDFSRTDETMRAGLLEMFSDLPEYVCLVFVCVVTEFKMDGRIKANAAMKKLITEVEFTQPQTDELYRWIARHFKSGGKTVDKAAAEHLLQITGASMNTMAREIDKLCSYAQGRSVTIEDMNALVTPVPEAMIYEMTDAIALRRYEKAFAVLETLLEQQEAPHKIIYSISAKLRQMLAACVLQKQGGSMSDLMDMLGIRFDFQARSVWNAASSCGLRWCKKAAELCCTAAYDMNSSGAETEDTLKLLLTEMAAI